MASSAEPTEHASVSAHSSLAEAVAIGAARWFRAAELRFLLENREALGAEMAAAVPQVRSSCSHVQAEMIVELLVDIGARAIICAAPFSK